MKKVENKARWLIIIILGLVILANIIGLIIDILIETSVVLVPNINMRGLSLATILSVAFIAIGIIFWIKHLKRKKKNITLWWHILAAISLITIVYKLVKPTVLTTLIPYYFPIMLGLIIILWFLVFNHLKKYYKEAF